MPVGTVDESTLWAGRSSATLDLSRRSGVGEGFPAEFPEAKEKEEEDERVVLLDREEARLAAQCAELRRSLEASLSYMYMLYIHVHIAASDRLSLHSLALSRTHKQAAETTLLTAVRRRRRAVQREPPPGTSTCGVGGGGGWRRGVGALYAELAGPAEALDDAAGQAREALQSLVAAARAWEDMAACHPEGHEEEEAPSEAGSTPTAAATGSPFLEPLLGLAHDDDDDDESAGTSETDGAVSSGRGEGPSPDEEESAGAGARAIVAALMGAAGSVQSGIEYCDLAKVLLTPTPTAL